MLRPPKPSSRRCPAGCSPAVACVAPWRAGTNEDEIFVILPSELPVFASSVRLLFDTETLSATMQVRVVAYRMLGSGFGRAPVAICGISGTGLTAPVL
jgi:hypothetical protein